MNWKEFLKPDWRRILLFLILFVFLASAGLEIFLFYPIDVWVLRIFEVISFPFNLITFLPFWLLWILFAVYWYLICSLVVFGYDNLKKLIKLSPQQQKLFRIMKYGIPTIFIIILIITFASEWLMCRYMDIGSEESFTLEYLTHDLEGSEEIIIKDVSIPLSRCEACEVAKQAWKAMPLKYKKPECGCWSIEHNPVVGGYGAGWFVACGEVIDTVPTGLAIDEKTRVITLIIHMA
jgi:hypothetical protein